MKAKTNIRKVTVIGQWEFTGHSQKESMLKVETPHGPKSMQRTDH